MTYALFWRAGKDKTANSYVIEIPGDLDEHLLRWNTIKRNRVTKVPLRPRATGRFECWATDVAETDGCSSKGVPGNDVHVFPSKPLVLAEPRMTELSSLSRASPGLATEDASIVREPAAPRVRANELVQIHVKQPTSYPRPLKTEEIVKALMKEFSITRNSALSAATKAVQQLDPGNVLRRSRAAPVARTLSVKILEEIATLASEGLSGSEIARRLKLHKRTVNQNLKKMREKT